MSVIADMLLLCFRCVDVVHFVLLLSLLLLILLILLSLFFFYPETKLYNLVQIGAVIAEILLLMLFIFVVVVFVAFVVVIFVFDPSNIYLKFGQHRESSS